MQQKPRREANTEEKQFDERVVHIDRVARVVRGGRRFRFRALVVIGDHKSRVGIGSAKGADVTAAVTKAVEVAKKHLITIPLYKDTLPHEVEAKVGGAVILIKPASPGTGLIAGGVVRVILEVGGISNALSKSLGSSNKTNTAYATIKALQQIVPAKQWITRPESKPKTAESAPKIEEQAPAKTEPAKKTVKPAVKKAATKKTKDKS
ncbi:MAG TPA: 30S ribosomal protein S5 [Patescibacteria group bacterium]|nr:30S ribosomal protein S5 [Patescibacteria group bacterium]